MVEEIVFLTYYRIVSIRKWQTKEYTIILLKVI